MRVISRTSTAIVLEHVFGNDAGYPFNVTLHIRYELVKQGLRCETNVRNTGTISAPFGDGWHPYFNITADKATLHIPSSNRLIADSRTIPTKKTIRDTRFSKPRSLRGIVLDDCFTVKRKGTATVSGSGMNVVLRWNGYPYIQVFTPPNRGSTAIEPMTCAPNAFNNGLGLIILKPQEEWCGSYEILQKL